MKWILKGLILLSLCGVVFGGAGWFGYQILIAPKQVPPQELVGGKPVPPADPSLPEFEKAMSVKASRQPVAAREALARFMEGYPFSTKLGEARKALGALNSDIFFSTLPAPEKIRYEVRPGDSLDRIKRKLKITPELLMRCNNLDDPRRLRVGQVLMVSPVDFSVVIDRKAHTVTLFNQKRFFREYPAASWSAPEVKKGVERVALPAKVSKTQAWYNGAPVVFGSKEYAGSARWVELTVKGYTLYTEGGPKPGAGIGMSPEEMEEISTLLAKDVPVVIR